MKKIVFLGTPEFAVPSLRALCAAEDMDVSLVVSQPDRKRHRNKYSATPVKLCAIEEQCNILTAQSINEADVFNRIYAKNPDFLVVIAFGQLIGKRYLEAFKDRIINIHGSLLPAYRGAAPMQRAMLDGLSVSGLTSMLIVKEMDAGDMLKKVEVEIRPEDTFRDFHDRMAQASPSLLLDTLRNFDTLYEHRQAQNPEEVTFASKISKEDGWLDFSLSAAELWRKVKVLKENPGTRFWLGESQYKVHEAHVIEQGSFAQKETGQVLRADESGIYVQTKEDILVLEIVQAANRRALPVSDFLRGNSEIQEGVVFHVPER